MSMYANLGAKVIKVQMQTFPRSIRKVETKEQTGYLNLDLKRPSKRQIFYPPRPTHTENINSLPPHALRPRHPLQRFFGLRTTLRLPLASTLRRLRQLPNPLH